jgi:chromosome segregation ATPase
MSELTELREQLDQLSNRLEDAQEYAALKEEQLQAAEEKARALERDAKRYRWLRNEAWGCNLYRKKRSPHVVEFDVARRPIELAEEALDAAIDKAISDDVEG